MFGIALALLLGACTFILFYWFFSKKSSHGKGETRSDAEDLDPAPILTRVEHNP